MNGAGEMILVIVVSIVLSAMVMHRIASEIHDRMDELEKHVGVILQRFADAGIDTTVTDDLKTDVKMPDRWVDWDEMQEVDGPKIAPSRRNEWTGT